MEKNKRREEEIAEQGLIDLSGKRQQEIESLNKELKARGLEIHEVPSNGNWYLKSYFFALFFKFMFFF